MGRAPCCDKANVKKGPWSPEEDAKLKAYIENYGTGGNWIALPQKIGLKRCGKSCRLRWLNYLRPNIKHGGFSEEEDNLICSLYISIGSRWSIIAAQLPGRTDNDIKNYWNTRLKKKLLGRRKQANLNQIVEDPIRGGYNTEEGSASLTNSAMERLQLHMQLQNPFSFYNNPALWPNKLHPLQEKAIQALQTMNGNNSPNFPLMETSLPNPQEGRNLDISEPPSSRDANMPRIDSHVLSPTCAMPVVPKPDVLGQAGAMSFQAELDNFLGNRSVVDSFMGHEGHGSATMADQFECLKDLNTMWWANELDTKSTSSNSWDSNPGLQPAGQGMLQDYVLGYNM